MLKRPYQRPWFALIGKLYKIKNGYWVSPNDRFFSFNVCVCPVVSYIVKG